MSVNVITGDCRDVLATLPAQSAHCCVTSPPYFGLRDYGMGAQIGLEPTPDAFIAELVAVFREVKRVLRDDGTLFLNIGDSYTSATKGSCGTGKSGLKAPRNDDGSLAAHGASFQGQHTGERKFDLVACGLKPKDLIGIPWMLAFALRADGWYLRQEIIWHKPNPMPESVTDRCTKAHESLFLLSKRPTYYFDAAAIAEPALCPSRDREAINGEDAVVRKERGFSNYLGTGETRNKRSVWTVPTQPYSGAHFATFPPALIEPCILAGCPVGGMVLDPFGGAGTTGLVADRLQRSATLIELNPEYAGIASRRIGDDAPLLGVAA